MVVVEQYQNSGYARAFIIEWLFPVLTAGLSGGFGAPARAPDVGRAVPARLNLVSAAQNPLNWLGKVGDLATRNHVGASDP